MSFSFDPQQGLIIVPVELWGPTGSVVLRLAIDTGATSMVVNVGMLCRLEARATGSYTYRRKKGEN